MICETIDIAFKLVTTDDDTLETILKRHGKGFYKDSVLCAILSNTPLSLWEAIVANNIDVYETYSAGGNGLIFETNSNDAMSRFLSNLTV